MDKLYCLMCNDEMIEDNFCSRNPLVLTDERGQVSEISGAWCDETGWSRMPPSEFESLLPA